MLGLSHAGMGDELAKEQLLKHEFNKMKKKKGYNYRISTNLRVR